MPLGFVRKSNDISGPNFVENSKLEYCMHITQYIEPHAVDVGIQEK